jgi:signal transduction histidine kinase
VEKGNKAEFSLVERNQNLVGILVAASIPLFVLPARISEGQWKDPVNLIGSEFVIFFMSLACWHSINFIQQRYNPWQGLILSLLCCCVLSNLFYFTFNPIFKDFPFRTASNPLWIKILMLSSRGILMSLILIPAAYYLKRDREAHLQRIENEKLALEKAKIENRLLERAVLERTLALQQALGSLEESQAVLEHQLYIQSRLVASITHDVSGPLNFLVFIAERISQLAANKDYESIDQFSPELHRSLQSMSGFVNNLLEFAKLPVRQKLTKTETVSLAALIQEKAALFEGIIHSRQNTLRIEIDPSIHVISNARLLGIVLHNLIDNANKNTRLGEIRIKTHLSDSCPVLVLENTGNGIPEAIASWVNADAGTKGTSKTPDSPEISGIGLILVKEIAALLGIKLFMQSDPNGTKVYLTFSVVEQEVQLRV